jgi:His/Glu/Gln/Arg/opine family amino acid ABC transporter permease subunit
VLCYLTEYQKRWLNRLIIGFVSLMRAIPFLILAYLLYYGLPEVGISMDAWTAGLVALIIYHGAYFLKILRSQPGIFRRISRRRWRRAFRATKYTGGLFCPISSLRRCRCSATS